MDQGLLAPPHGFSQLAASFIAFRSQGIRRAPFLAFAARSEMNHCKHMLWFYNELGWALRMPARYFVLFFKSF